jgi:hypothetical protein
MDDSTVFGDDPVAMAARWVEEGARRLHLVDLNGAFAGEPVNGAAVRAITKAFPDLPVQIGGGIRSRETVSSYLEAGVQLGDHRHAGGEGSRRSSRSSAPSSRARDRRHRCTQRHGGHRRLGRGVARCRGRSGAAVRGRRRGRDRLHRHRPRRHDAGREHPGDAPPGEAAAFR